jgi:hypothetical protein
MNTTSLPVWFLLLSSFIASSCGCVVRTEVPPPTDNDGTCVPTEVTRTRVFTNMCDGCVLVLLCTECDIDECSSHGARCDVEGEPCDFYGKLGVCRGCCDSEYGELHCALATP